MWHFNVNIWILLFFLQVYAIPTHVLMEVFVYVIPVVLPCIPANAAKDLQEQIVHS